MPFRRPIFVLFISILFSMPVVAQTTTPAFLNLNERQNCWVDSVFTNMSPDDRIAQLIMVAGYSNRRPSYEDSLVRLVQTAKLGGVVMFQGGPVRQAQLTNRLQAVSKVPLLMAIDAEWGLAMRLDSTVRYPYQMTLGAMQGNDSLIYRMGANLARQARRLGLHINFAPTVDVNNNPNNPVINFRSFGENKYDVARKALAYVKGMQDNQLLTSIKHFPGHGDTGTDSHFDLPLIAKSRTQLDSLELYPFRELIKAGASGVMVAHLNVPALDTTRNRPSTLSPAIVTNLLKNELGFQGLTFSDAMNMKALTKYFPSGQADQLGIEAGLDILEFTEDVPAALAKIKQAVAAGRISQASLDARCLKVLRAKVWAGLDRYKPIDLTNLVSDLNSVQDDLLNRKLTEASLTVLKNERNLLPLQHLDTLRIASVAVESDKITAFQQMVANYTQVNHFNITSRTPDSTLAQVRDSLKNYNLILVDVHLNNIRPAARYGLQAKTAALVSELVSTGKAVVTVFGNPYVLDKLTFPMDTVQTARNIEQARAVVMPYQLTNYTEELSAQLIFGAIGASGKLPVTVNQRFRYGDGIPVQPIGRMKYTIPEEVGIDSRYLAQQVDSLVNVGMTQKAFPGCVVQMAKDGKVIFRKAYGNHTYDASLGAEPKPVQLDDLYDMASVTKVSTSTPALMKLVDEGKFNLDGKMADYLPFLKKSNKANLIWRDVLTHQARLKAWIPFWMDTKNPDGSWKPKTFKNERSGRYPIEVTDSLFEFKNYPKVIYQQIRDSPLNEKKEYVYSDLSFIMYPLVVKRLTGVNFEEYVKATFFRPLGATTLTFNPRRFYSLDRIVPTEYDSLFRKTLIWGRVHDEGAAMLNGLSGHAGLFGSANDLMKVYDMYRRMGSYGGQQFISQKTMAEFTRYQFPELGNRRGLGFDKPSFKYSGNGPRSATKASFGHSGFTGTFVWVDPDPAYNLTYVFLCNRVYPTRNNNTLGNLNTRTNIVEALYQATKRGIQ
ncbi:MULTISPECIES: glycoside hydrolase family 3 N-terminal domain-containing protein [unclassified Spirosoma]|uniref:glycoside hydrolase family 3 N-terminal domain-containing protein n=1 Tax=unclassified Spirosoma TaxID=2621999 RepID=UPI00095D6F3A|nr:MULTISPECIES: glycoside hydrolase family 3 N-terminal domain-containing protein [unclassified Spirosoma]MBN8823440.1 serine hydrolase [Spirosoma sp.]OJW71944.1 MAG: serine hydrolase [Spirosoma sp. 48-14]